MDTRTIELIAVGASITANCQPCLNYHVRKVQEAGATPEDIREAVAVGKAVRQGSQGKMDQHAEAVLRKAGAADDEAEGEEPSAAAGCADRMQEFVTAFLGSADDSVGDAPSAQEFCQSAMAMMGQFLGRQAGTAAATPDATAKDAKAAPADTSCPCC